MCIELICDECRNSYRIGGPGYRPRKPEEQGIGFLCVTCSWKRPDYTLTEEYREWQIQEIRARMFIDCGFGMDDRDIRTCAELGLYGLGEVVEDALSSAPQRPEPFAKRILRYMLIWLLLVLVCGVLGSLCGRFWG